MKQSTELRIGINGFGRIGRAIARILASRGHHKIVHVNDLNPDLDNLLYLFKYDTTYGRLKHEIRRSENGFIVNGMPVQVTRHKGIAEVNWADSGCDLVIEATGVGQNEKDARLLTTQGMPVIVTHACPTADYTVVFGVTDAGFDPSRHKLVSTSICDANACAPVLKVLNDNFGVKSGFITTLHPWLSYQNLMDGPSKSQANPDATYSHYVLGRSSVGSLIPKTTTVVSACERVLPELKGLIQCFSYRVPTPVVSTADLSITVERETSVEDIVRAFKAASMRQEIPHVYRLTDEPLISVDYLKDEHSAIVDMRWIMVNQGHQVKMVLWYDNEWGYSSRVVDTIDLVARRSQ
jgi:glyceraldehyde 3-phosphate dehydrogenase